ncbi:MAG: MFS transporter [Candidatus Limnocylindrales bacterium]
MPASTALRDIPGRAATWARRWSGILPLLVAEFILWTGFGALLPVMPLYFTEQGVDIALLGFVIAAWPAARLVTEPLFGVLADRSPRVPLMVAGLVVAGSAVGAMAIWTGPALFVGLRALSGLGTAMYDPAARGYITDASPEDRRGEAFGMYSAAQNGGILLGPAIGGLGTALVGGYRFVLAFAAVTTFAAAIAVALRVREAPRHSPWTTGRSSDRVSSSGQTYAEFPAEAGHQPARASTLGGAPGSAASPIVAPRSLRNRFILAAMLVNLAGYFGGGLYETIWALFVTDRGGSVELIGATFAVFGLTTILLSPFAGRIVDRRGPFPFIVSGVLVMVVTMLIYPQVGEPLLYLPLVAIEAVGFSFLGPATYLVIARGTPEGRSSTAQGLLGAAGTIGTIAASIGAGILAAIDLAIPFYVGAGVEFALLIVTLVVATRHLRAMQPRAARA